MSGPGLEQMAAAIADLVDNDQQRGLTPWESACGTERGANAGIGELGVGGGTKFTVRGPITGPSGATWNITTAWGADSNGTIRLITATP